MEKPKSDVMRFDSSPLMSVSTTDGSVPVFWFDTVGSDSSSATNGSSIVIVAGKKRDPAKPWANVPAVGKIVSAAARASLVRPFELTANIEGSRVSREQAIGPAAPDEGSAAGCRSTKRQPYACVGGALAPIAPLSRRARACPAGVKMPCAGENATSSRVAPGTSARAVEPGQRQQAAISW